MRRELSDVVRDRGDLMVALDAAVAAGRMGAAFFLVAVLENRICLLNASAGVVPGTSAAFIAQFIDRAGVRPSVILIGDDDGKDLGPTGWPGIERAVRWARWVFLRGREAEQAHYVAALNAASEFGRVVVIECNEVTMPEWERIVWRLNRTIPGIRLRPE